MTLPRITVLRERVADAFTEPASTSSELALTGLRLDDGEEAPRLGARVLTLTCTVAGPGPPWQSQLVRLSPADRAVGASMPLGRTSRPHR